MIALAPVRPFFRWMIPLAAALAFVTRSVSARADPPAGVDVTANVLGVAGCSAHGILFAALLASDKYPERFILPFLYVSGILGTAAGVSGIVLEARYAAAFNAKDVDAIMKVYVPGPGLVVFDVIPPRQYVGQEAYRKDWQDFLATLKGPLRFEISDLAIRADRMLAYSHSIQHVTGTDTKGQPIDLTVRVSDVYRKIKGQWLIEHEHVSVPVDLSTGKPDLASKP